MRMQEVGFQNRNNEGYFDLLMFYSKRGGREIKKVSGTIKSKTMFIAYYERGPNVGLV